MLSRLLRGLGLLAYALLMVLVFGLAAYTSFSLFVRSGVTTVPTVTGLTRAEAANVLADQGLSLRTGEESGRYDDKIPAGLEPLNPYGASKAAAEQLIAGQAATGKLGAVSLRLFSVAGGRQGLADPDLSRIIPKAEAWGGVPIVRRWR